MPSPRYAPGTRFRDLGQAGAYFLLERYDVHGVLGVRTWPEGDEEAWSVVPSSFEQFYEPIAADTCRCEYPCSCTQERREAAKDRRIAELEAQLRDRIDADYNAAMASAVETGLRERDDRIAELEAELQEIDDALDLHYADHAPTRARRLDSLVRAKDKAINSWFRSWHEASLRAGDLTMKTAGLQASINYLSGELSNIRGLYDDLREAVEAHRSVPGYVTSVRDLTLYRALEADDAD